jgi:cytochrome P450
MAATTARPRARAVPRRARQCGDAALVVLAGTGHDPAAFADPEPLARIELRVTLAQLARRFPDLRLAADPAELPRREDSLTGGLLTLPVEW